MAGYYEWQGQKGNKQPFYITDRDTGGLVVAGLYDSWGDDNQLSCTIITRPANTGLDSIHSRMPVMLTPESSKQWLEHDLNTKDFLTEINTPEVIWYPVNKAVGNVKNDFPKLIEPIDK